MSRAHGQLRRGGSVTAAPHREPGRSLTEGMESESALPASQLKLNISRPLPEAAISTIGLLGSQAFTPWIELSHWPLFLWGVLSIQAPSEPG
ncbi:mCG1026724 [Mus musculus]|nr:mCG1026724 [Mus musculus]